MSKYIINVSFQTRVNKTTRTLEIAESFGLGLDEKEWTLYDNLELEVKQGDVVYITGQSGSGKSVVLRELQRQMKDEGLSVASIDDFTFDNEVNVIDQLGKTTSDALGLLSMAGLNDAYLFVRKPSEMSDGQKYRLKIAKLIESGAKVWAADEFGAVLDRVTVFPDPAGAYRQHARGESDVDIFKEKGFLRVDYSKKHPPIADRVNAVNRMLMTASGDIRLYIDPKCKHLIDSLEKVIYKPGTRDMDKTGGIEHSADALGQQLISKPVRVRTSGSGDGGSGRRSGASGHSGKSNEGGMFSGLRGNIFLLGEIGDAARTVTDIMFGWQKPIVEAAAEMERMRVMLRGLNKEKSNPGQAAADDMKYIVDMAKSAPFAMEALTDSFVKFRSAGLDPTDGSLKTLVDSVARFGGDSELLKRASIAVQQMSGKGVVSMEELRQQLGEAIPTAMNAMAKAAGLTMGELTKAVASGTVEAKNALALMFKELKMQNEGAASEMMNTFTGTLAQMQTAFTLFADKVGQAGYLSSLKEGMKELTSLMNSTDGMSFAHSLGSGLTTAVDGLRDLAMWLIKNQELVIAFGKVVAAMVAFKLLKAGISGVIGTASQMTSAFANMSTTIQGTFNLASTAVIATIVVAGFIAWSQVRKHQKGMV